MITVEQLKNLNPGDPLIVHGKFKSVYSDGDIGIEVDVAGGYGDGNGVIKDTIYSHPSCVSLLSVKPIEMRHTTKIPEQPKHDPCRKFKEGDIVDYRRALYGRDYETIPDPGNYKLARVISSENAFTGMVGVEFIAADGGEDAYFAVPWFHLALVTPVEELEPYSVQESDAFDIVRDGKIVMTIPFTVDDYYDYEQAKTAAKDWCKHLNTKWQKLQTLIKTTVCQIGQE